jgi:putative transposase
MNHKKLRRLYAEERLQVRRRGGRKRALGTRAPMALPQAPNQRWSLDFASDALADGRRFRILAIVDDFSRECLCLVPDTSLSGKRVARELDAIIAVRDQPLSCVSDNGTELTSTAILTWSQEHRVDWHYIAPGKPQQNECLCRILHRPVARRVPERDAVHLARSRPRRTGGMAARLQHHQAAQRDR